MLNLNAKNLKDALWKALNDIQSGDIQPGQGDAIAAQAREILRTTNTQLRISQQAKRQVPSEVIGFAENVERP